MTKEDLIAKLHSLNISFERFDHAPVFTCAQSKNLKVTIPGAHTKQLLMRDKKKRHYVLAIVMHDKHVDTKALGEELETGRLSFASSDDLMRLLGVTPGSVTPFGLFMDGDHIIRVIMDADAWHIGQFQFHPMINDSTLVIDQDGFEMLCKETGHAFEVRRIPQ